MKKQNGQKKHDIKSGQKKKHGKNGQKKTHAKIDRKHNMKTDFLGERVLSLQHVLPHFYTPKNRTEKHDNVDRNMTKWTEKNMKTWTRGHDNTPEFVLTNRAEKNDKVD